MFLNDSEWRDVKDPDDLFKRLQVKARSGADRDFLLGKTTAQKLIPIKARRRRLNFYRTYELVEIEIDLRTLHLEETYQRAAIYALVNDEEARLLNGKSAVLHELTDRDGANPHERELDLGTVNRAQDYLRFFCSFVVGIDGPFTLVESADDLVWPEQNSERQLESFAALIERRREELNWPADLLPLTGDDLRFFADHDKDALLRFRDRTAKRDEAKQHADLRSAQRIPRPVVTRPDLVQPGSFAAEGVVVYGETLFDARFLIRPQGMIEMVEDNPLQMAPLPVWTFHPRVPVLLIKKPRYVETADSLGKALRGVASDSRNSDAKNLRILKNLRVKGDIDLRRLDLEECVVLDDVEIDGDLILEEAVLRGGLSLSSVKIRGRLRAGMLTCHGEFRSEGLVVEGLYDRNRLQLTTSDPVDALPAVDLHRARVRSELMMRRARIRGALDLRDVEVDGVADLSGLQVSPRPPFNQMWSCVTTGARFQRSLSFGPPRGHRAPGELDRSEITGGFNGAGMELSGVLDLHGFRVQGARPRRPVVASEVTPEWLEAWKGKAGYFAYDRDKGEVVRVSTDLAEAPTSTNEEPPGTVSLKGTKIAGSVQAAGVIIGGDFDLEAATISRDLNLGPTAVSRFRPEPAKDEIIPPEEVVVQPPDSEGRLFDFHRSWIGGNFVLSGASIGGQVYFLGVYLCGRLDATGAKLEGGLFLASDTGRGIRTIIGPRWKENEPVLALATASFESIIMAGARVLGTVNLARSRIRGFLDGDSQSPFRTEIAGDLVLSGASVGSDLRFGAAKIGGVVQAITGSFNRVQLRPVWVGEQREGQAPTAEAVTPVEVGGILLQTVAADSFDFCALRVSASSRAEAASGCVIMKNVEVKHDLELSKESLEFLHFGLEEKDPRRNQQNRPSDFPTQIEDRICLDAVTIGGDLVLSHTNCGNKIELSQVKILGDLVWSAEANRQQSSSPAPPSTNRAADSSSKTPKRFACTFQRTKIDGDAAVELRTLERLELNRSVFGGHLLLKESPGGEATKIRIEESQFTALKFSTEAERIAADLFLTKSRIDDLEFHRKLPAEIGLKHVQIKRWLFELDTDGSVEGNRLKRLREVLATSRPFDRSNYAGISRSLRDGGDVKGADRVYVDMRWRAVKESAKIRRPNFNAFQRPKGLGWLKSVWKQPLETLIGITTGFWTAGYRLLLFACLPTLILTLFVVQVPENFSPSSSQLDGYGNKPASPPRTEWNAEEKWAIILAYHVPIISVVSAPHWELAENRSLLLPLPTSKHEVRSSSPDHAVITPAGSPTPNNAPAGPAQSPQSGFALPGFSPAGYGLFVRMLHWIAWPLALGGLAATIQRRRSTD